MKCCSRVVVVVFLPVFVFGAVEEPSPCLVTMINDEYMSGHEVFMQSFLAHNPWFPSSRWKMVVLDGGLTKAGRAHIIRTYARTIIRGVPYDDIATTRITSPGGAKKFQRNVDKLLALHFMTECRPIVKVDTGDMLVMGNIEGVFHAALNGTDNIFCARAAERKVSLEELARIRARKAKLKASKRHLAEETRVSWNAGLVVFQSRTLGPAGVGEIQRVLSKERDGTPHEQAILNRIFLCGPVLGAPSPPVPLLLPRAPSHSPAGSCTNTTSKSFPRRTTTNTSFPGSSATPASHRRGSCTGPGKQSHGCLVGASSTLHTFGGDALEQGGQSSRTHLRRPRLGSVLAGLWTSST